jgi:hypothetical protein
MNRITTRFITSITAYFKDAPKIQLGRWTIEHTQHRQNIKVDSSNEDHCGVCQNGRKVQQQSDEDIEEYIRYFF